MRLNKRAGAAAGVAAATLLAVLAVPAQAATLVATSDDAAGSSPLAHRSALHASPEAAAGRFVVVTKRPSAVAKVAAALRELEGDGITVVNDAPVGRTITVEAEPGSEAVSVALALDGVVDVVPEVTYSLFDTPDDPALDDQAASLNVLRLPTAWDVTHGSSDVRIAVIDTGVAVNHPDLAGKVVATHNAVDGSSSVTDDEGHGTFVASVAAAATDNEEGVAGAGWDSSLMAVKVARPDGKITNAAVATGIDWAVANGADVINLSLGSTTDDVLTRDAVARALDADVVVVAAAGNSGVTTKMYPAALPGVVAVGATTVGGGKRAAFSQYGSWVDVGAPGVSIIGANAEYAAEDDYVIGDGTSFASPLVAGIVGLLRDVRPDLDAAEVHAALKATTNGKDYGFFAGVVNASSVLGYQFSLPGPDVAEPDAGDSVSGTLDVELSVPGGVDADHAQVSFVGGPTVTEALSGGAATVSLPTYGRSGTQTVHAVLCQGSFCSPTGTDVSVDVANAAPVITAPLDGSGLDADFTVSATASAPAVRFLVDGSTVLGTDISAPFSLLVPISQLTPGQHTLTAVVCDAAGSVCATADPSDPVDVHVDRLRPTIDGLGPNPFSPNGDGVKDITRLTYTLDVASDVSIRIEDADGNDVRTRALGVQAAGAHTLVWSGVADAGPVVPTGTYSVFVETTASDGPLVLHGSASRTLRVDRTAPKLASATSTYPTVYPINDDYRDSTLLSVTVGEVAKAVTVTVRDTHGKAVWSATKADAAAGLVSLRFTGHSTSGARLAGGGYTYAFKVTDQAGNVSSSSSHAVNVSWKKLVDRTFTKTVTALAASDGSYYTDPSDGCSHVTAYGSGQLRWESCGGPVETIHHVTLPKAVAYGAARVSAHAHGSSGSVAYFGYLAQDDTVTGATTFSATNGTHSAGAVHVTASLLKGRDLRWLMLVTDGDTYVADTFSVVFHYSVLA